MEQASQATESRPAGEAIGSERSGVALIQVGLKVDDATLRRKQPPSITWERSE